MRSYKKIIALFSFLIVSVSVFAIQLDFSWDVGDVFVRGGLDIQKDVKGTLEAGSRVGEVVFSDNDSSFALQIVPFQWDCINRYEPTSMENRFSFLNLELFYDIFHFDKENMNMGPYLIANYLDLVNMKFNTYQVDLGFKFNYFWKRSDFYYFNPETFTLRTGVRIRDNDPSVFIEGSVNLGGLVMCFMNSSYENAMDLKDSL